MMFRSLSQVVGWVLARRSGLRGRGDVAVEVLESRCLLTESSGYDSGMPNSGMPNSGMPGSGDSLMGGSGSGSSGSSTTPMPGQDSLPSSSDQTYLPPTTSQDSLPPTSGQDSLSPTSGQDSMPTSSGQDSVPTTYGSDSMPIGAGDDSVGSGYTEFTAENWPEWWGNYESNVPLAVDDPNEEPFDLDVYEQRTGDTSLRAYYEMQAMYLQMLNSGIDIFSMQTTSTVDPDESYYQPVEENVTPPADIVSEVTINVFNADAIVEGAGYAAFTIQVSSVGLGDAPISVIVSGRYRGSDGRNRELSTKVLTFDLAHTERTVQIPIPEDDGWHPDNALGVSVYLQDQDLVLSASSVDHVLATVVEDDPYYDPESETIDYENYWMTEEAALLRASPDAAWYATWLPIYEPVAVEDETSEETSDEPLYSLPPVDPIVSTESSLSSPPYVAPTPPPENSQSSPPIIASAPVVDSSTSQSSSPPATEPIVVTSETSGAGSSVETTSTVDNSTVNSDGSGGSSSGDTALVTASYEAGMSGNGSGSSSGGATDGTDSSSSNTATMNTEMSTTTGSSTTENSLASSDSTDLMTNQNSTSGASSDASGSTSATSSSSSTGSNSTDNQFVESPNTLSVMDLLLTGSDSLQGGSSADPTLGSDAMLYMGSSGNVLMA